MEGYILRGCMPTKALLHAADVRSQAKRSGMGLEPGEIGFDFGKVMQGVPTWSRSLRATGAASCRTGSLS